MSPSENTPASIRRPQPRLHLSSPILNSPNLMRRRSRSDISGAERTRYNFSPSPPSSIHDSPQSRISSTPHSPSLFSPSLDSSPTVRPTDPNYKYSESLDVNSPGSFKSTFQMNLLTPPSTPETQRPSYRNRSATFSDPASKDMPVRYSEAAGVCQNQACGGLVDLETLFENARVPRPVRGTCAVHRDAYGRSEQYGSGAWSSVSAASLVSGLALPGKALATPSRISRVAKQLVAVKAAGRNDAFEVLMREAQILTFLQPAVGDFIPFSKHIVTFHGWDSTNKSLVLEALPLTLDSFCKDMLLRARQDISTQTMFDPVIGTAQWTHLAKSLVSGLEFLHARNIIHGDIKPANVLLRQRTGIENAINQDGNGASSISVDPVYCDFSSSHFESSRSVPPETAAITTSYTAPEILKAFQMRTATSPALVTKASDVYSLGVTLLNAAIGSSVYAGLRLEMQKISCAKEGRPLDFARCTDQASRVMPGKLVSNALEGAVRKDAATRLTSAGWVDVLASDLSLEK